MVLDAPYGAKILGNRDGKAFTEPDLVVAYLTEIDEEPALIREDLVVPDAIQVSADRANWMKIQVTQDFSQIHFEKRFFTVNESVVEISGILESDFDEDWRAKVVASSAAVAEVPSSWQRHKDGGWKLSVQLQEPIHRPSPIRIQFYHPSNLPIERSIVFLPASK